MGETKIRTEISDTEVKKIKNFQGKKKLLFFKTKENSQPLGRFLKEKKAEKMHQMKKMSTYIKICKNINKRNI